MRRSRLLLWLLCLATATIASTATATAAAAQRAVPTINAEKARAAAREQVMWHDRVCPLSTLAHDFLKSVYGKSTYKGLSAVQVVYGWRLRPDAWKDEQMILIPDADLRSRLGIEGQYAAFSQLFDDTLGYRLNTIGDDLPERMRQLVRESAPVVELDEKVAQIILLTQGALIQPRPDSIPPLGSLRVEAEVLWNDQPNPLLIILVLAAALPLAHLLRRKKKSPSAN